MSKYDLLWQYLKNQTASSLQLTFEQIAQIAGTALDHSFLGSKKELPAYGWKVSHISLKERWVSFEKQPGGIHQEGQ